MGLSERFQLPLTGILLKWTSARVLLVMRPILANYLAKTKHIRRYHYIILMTGQIIYLNNIDMNMSDAELMNMSKDELIRMIKVWMHLFHQSQSQKKRVM